MHLDQNKNENPCSSRFEAVCVMYYDAKTHSHLQQKKRRENQIKGLLFVVVPPENEFHF